METPGKFRIELSKAYSYPVILIDNDNLALCTPKEHSYPVSNVSFDVFLLKNQLFRAFVMRHNRKVCSKIYKLNPPWAATSFLMPMDSHSQHNFISLDYDLAGKETGYDVLKYMVEQGNHVKHINIHSDHSIGVPKMEAYVKEHFPNAELTFNPL